MPQPGTDAENYTIFGYSLHSTQQASTCLSEAMPSHSTHYPGTSLFLLYAHVTPILQKLHWLPVRFPFVFSNLQHLCIKFCIVVILLILNRSCLLVVVPIVLGIVTQIVNTLQFLLSIHQSSSQPNILAIVLPLMLLRSGMTSLKMFAVQHQLPPSERSLKHTCLQKPTHHSLPVTSVSPWYDLAMSLD